MAALSLADRGHLAGASHREIDTGINHNDLDYSRSLLAQGQVGHQLCREPFLGVSSRILKSELSDKALRSSSRSFGAWAGLHGYGLWRQCGALDMLYISDKLAE
ncbi:hypothetical protein M8818_003210 [Zalaria obscura]|uniref:Uncharacterized protein n=1 Tax=Zalaria obscura TaxID=2024903 RepID=A0ACC3SIF7_9PEZI